MPAGDRQLRGRVRRHQRGGERPVAQRQAERRGVEADREARRTDAATRRARLQLGDLDGLALVSVDRLACGHDRADVAGIDLDDPAIAPVGSGARDHEAPRPGARSRDGGPDRVAARALDGERGVGVAEGAGVDSTAEGVGDAADAADAGAGDDGIAGVAGAAGEQPTTTSRAARPMTNVRREDMGPVCGEDRRPGQWPGPRMTNEAPRLVPCRQSSAACSSGPWRFSQRRQVT